MLKGLCLLFLKLKTKRSRSLRKPKKKALRATWPDSVTPPAPGPAEESPEVLPKEGESIDNKEVNVTKIDTDPPSVEESGPISASQEETQANDENSNTDRESAQAQAGDDEITAKGENPNATAQNLQTAGKSIGAFRCIHDNDKKRGHPKGNCCTVVS